MNNHVTSLELSKKLKELGVKRESNQGFYWFDIDSGGRQQLVYINGDSGMRETIGFYGHTYGKKNKDYFVYPAYLSSEIGEM